MIGIPSQVPILTISSTIATWDWTLELIASLTDYDWIGRQQTSLCNVSYILANDRIALALNRPQCAKAQGLKDCGRQDDQNAQRDDSKPDRMVVYELS